jgi:hypothetical protein
MEDLIFGTLALSNSDFNQSDIEAEWKNLLQRQKTVQAVIDGEMPVDVLFGMLMEQSIEVSEYVDEVVENVEIIIARS